MNVREDGERRTDRVVRSVVSYFRSQNLIRDEYSPLLIYLYARCRYGASRSVVSGVRVSNVYLYSVIRAMTIEKASAEIIQLRSSNVICAVS